MPALAQAQRAAWARLRGELVRRLRDGSAPVQSIRIAVSAFDALPLIASPQPGASWLPSADEISHSDLQSALHDADLGHCAAATVIDSLVAAATAECHTLSKVAALDDQSRIAIRSGRLHSVWRVGSGETRGSEPALLVSGRRLRWLRRVHKACRCEHDGDDGDDDDDEQRFRRRLYRLLARYDAFAGGLGGAGSQAAVPPEVFATLEAWANVPAGTALEAFASPLNHRIAPGASAMLQPWFGSGFPDVDKAFGGRGSFFSISSLPHDRLSPTLQGTHYSEGARGPHARGPHAGGDGGVSPLLPLIANPPYLPALMARLTPALERLLTATGAPPTAAVVVLPAPCPPSRDRPEHEAPHARSVSLSPLCRARRVLPAGEHVFAPGVSPGTGRGLQSQRVRRSRPSPWATELLLLSNVSLGQDHSDQLLAAMAEAFK